MRTGMKDISPIVPFNKLPSTKAWKLTSELVRKLGKGKCYTCGARVGYSKLVAGHYREKRGGSATYFDLDNLRAQCGWYCNRQRHGAKDVYAMKLVAECGPKILSELIKRGSKSKVWRKNELEEIANQRQDLLNKLK